MAGRLGERGIASMKMEIHCGEDGRVDRVEYTPSRVRMGAYACLSGLGVPFFLLGCVRDLGHLYGVDAGHWLAMALDLATFPLFLSLTNHYVLRSQLYARLFRLRPTVTLRKDSLECQVRGKAGAVYRWDDLVKTLNYQLVFNSGMKIPLPPEFWKWHCEHGFLQELLEDVVLSKFTGCEYGIDLGRLYEYEPEQ